MIYDIAEDPGAACGCVCDGYGKILRTTKYVLKPDPCSHWTTNEIA